MGRVPDHSPTGAMKIGRHEILRRLGRGGMAELFLARVAGSHGSERLVALKQILADHANRPTFVKSFLEEARLVATLDHPNIAHVYDLGMADGQPFFTMEYVHGEDLRSTLRRTVQHRQKLPIAAAILIARDVAAALHHAHERRRPDGTSLGIVHRDVSPSNILVSYEGEVKLVDFGIAKAATSSERTQTGMVKGKLSYMSPEQARGAPIDHRSDVFALGIVLWEMITTQRLFQADNDLAVIQMIVTARPLRPSRLRPECAPELERIAMKALAPDLDARYQSAEELQLDLQELARGTEVARSSAVLRSHMRRLFEPEITAWREAQDAGVTLTDHVAGVADLSGDDEATVARGSRPAPPPRAPVGTRPATAPGAVSLRHAVSLCHAVSAPVVPDVSAYPSVRSDPSYVSIARQRTADPVLVPTSGRRARVVVALAALVAILVLVKLLVW